MDNALADLVRRRAADCCEYCRLPQAFSSARFQIDHIIAEQHGGRMVASNLALACLADNNHKGPNLNPRRQKWTRHFRWQGATLVGRTSVGRATIVVLAINSPHRIAQRAALIAEGVFPPEGGHGSR